MKKPIALLVAGMQVDHSSLGSLGGVADRLAGYIARQVSKATLCIGVREWHPPDHVSFAARHMWRKPGQYMALTDHMQMLWPMHCVRDSFGARWVPPLETVSWDRVVDVGMRPEVDHYSAFEEADGQSTGLIAWLAQQRIGLLVLAGLPLDGLLGHTFEAARSHGFDVRLLRHACAPLQSVEIPDFWQQQSGYWIDQL